MGKKQYKMSAQEWNSLPSLHFRNACLDFSKEVKLLKVLPSGSLKVADAVSIGGGMPVGYEVWVAKREGDRYRWYEGGSPCNSYSLKTPIISATWTDQNKSSENPKIMVKLYNEWHEYPTRQAAMDSLLDMMEHSDGAERDRYTRAFLEVRKGKKMVNTNG